LLKKVLPGQHQWPRNISRPCTLMKNKPLSRFVAYEPMLRPLGKSTGGGFRLTLEIPESEYQQIKDLNDPSLQNTTLIVEISREMET